MKEPFDREYLLQDFTDEELRCELSRRSKIARAERQAVDVYGL